MRINKKKRKRTKDIQDKFNKASKNKKIKTMIEFYYDQTNSIKSIAKKENTEIDVTTHFIKGKMLMFAKLFLKSFVYDFIDRFCFPRIIPLE